MKLPERAIKFPITTILIFVTLGVLGFISLRRIGLELFPNVGYPTAAVFTPYPGVGPFEVESGVSKPIEDAVSTINGVQKVGSTSTEGLSVVIVNFTWNTDMSTVVSEIREKISAIESTLPEGSERSVIFRFNPEVLPALTFTVSSPVEGMDLRRLVEKSITPEIERLQGVASTSVFGGRKSAVTVKLDLDAISKKEIPILRILQVFKGENVNLPGGSISLKDRFIVLRTIGEFSSTAAIGDVLLGYREGVAVFLKDVADIGLDYLPQEEFSRAGASPGVLVEVQKMQGHNTVDVIRRVKAALSGMKAGLPPSVEIVIRTDQSVSILESLSGLTDAAWQGGLLAVLVLVLFLRNFRSILIISLAIPVSVIATFSLMDFARIDMNIMSLAGLTLGVGMFVDNSIVVLEVIFRKQLSGMAPREAAILGAGEVTTAVTASTLTNIVVFVPLVFVSGLANIIMRDLAYTYSFSMIVSLLMALTLVPVLCVRFLKLSAGTTIAKRRLHGQKIDLEISLADVELHTGIAPVDRASSLVRRAILWLDEAYERALQWSIRHAVAVIAVAIGLFAASLASILLLGMEFLPETDEGRFTIALETKVESPFEKTETKVKQVEAILREDLGKRPRLAVLGDRQIGLGRTPRHHGKPPRQRFGVPGSQGRARPLGVEHHQRDLQKDPLPGHRRQVHGVRGGAVIPHQPGRREPQAHRRGDLRRGPVALLGLRPGRVRRDGEGERDARRGRFLQDGKARDPVQGEAARGGEPGPEPPGDRSDDPGGVQGGAGFPLQAGGRHL